MEFTEYRSESLKCLWPRIVVKTGFSQQIICGMKGFSTSVIDNICAINWKAGNPLEVCISVLSDYVVNHVVNMVVGKASKT